MDSLKQDSIAKAKEADSLAVVEKLQRKQDSIKEDSISKAKSKNVHAKTKSKKSTSNKTKKHQ